MGLGRPKQYEVLAGQRVLDHTLAAFVAVPALSQVVVVVAPGDASSLSLAPSVKVWPVGGATRAESVFNGLSALLANGAAAEDWVLVHDAARCLVTPNQIEQLMAACLTDEVGGLLALPLPDTLKVSTGAAEPVRVRQTLDRADKWLAQTPQMFRIGVLHRALAQAAAHGFAGVTDEASAVEALGLAPLLVPGSAHNVKVTYPEDLALAEAVLLHRQHLSGPSALADMPSTHETTT